LPEFIKTFFEYKMESLIFISANDCGACQGFKQVWPKIKEELSKEIEIVEINLKERRDAGNPRSFSDPSLMKYIGWFPTFLLKLNSKIEIFNGEMVNGQPDMKDKYPRNLEGFRRWIYDSKVLQEKAEEYKKEMEKKKEDRQDRQDRQDHQDRQESKNEIPLEIKRQRKLVSSIRGPSFEISGDRF